MDNPTCNEIHDVLASQGLQVKVEVSGCTEAVCVTNWVGWGSTEVVCVTNWVGWGGWEGALRWCASPTGWGGGSTEVVCVTNSVGEGCSEVVCVTSYIGTLMPVEYQLRPPLLQVYRTHTRPYTVCTLIFVGFNVCGFGWISMQPSAKVLSAKI